MAVHLDDGQALGLGALKPRHDIVRRPADADRRSRRAFGVRDSVDIANGKPPAAVAIPPPAENNGGGLIAVAREEMAPQEFMLVA